MITVGHRFTDTAYATLTQPDFEGRVMILFSTETSLLSQRNAIGQRF